MATNGKTATVKFTLDGKEVEAREGETIWQVAKRQGIAIPHLCYSPETGYRMRARAVSRFCQSIVADFRSLSVSSIASALSTGLPSSRTALSFSRSAS